MLPLILLEKGMEKQVHIFYSGVVQGVGFRFTAVSIADKLQVKGWVRNLADGRVEIVAQGKESALKDYISSINGHFQNFISNQDVSWSDAGDIFNDFRIKF